MPTRSWGGLPRRDLALTTAIATTFQASYPQRASEIIIAGLDERKPSEDAKRTFMTNMLETPTGILRWELIRGP